MVEQFVSLPHVPRRETDDPLWSYKGVLYNKKCTREALEAMTTLEIRSDDVFLITYPKAGTTWTQELVSMVMSGGDEKEIAKTHVFFRFPFMEMQWVHHYSQVGQVPCVYKFLDKMASPRTIKSHLQMDHLPPQIFTKKPKIIYVARNRKDAAVSFYYMHKGNKGFLYYSGWDEFLADYQKGKVQCGSWYDHTLAWWRKRHDDNVLFIKYEDMKRDLRGAVVQIADFLDCKLSAEAIDRTARHCEFSNMKATPSANPDSLGLYSKSKRPRNDDGNGTKPSFMRKGTVGDWQNYFTVEQNEAFDKDYNAKMKGTGLKFDFVLNWKKRQYAVSEYLNRD